MAKKEVIFLTGATGLVGSYLLKIFLNNNHKVYALSRSSKKATAKQRVIDKLLFWDKSVFDKYEGNLIIFEGDIKEPNLGLDAQTIDLLKMQVSQIYHCAAQVKSNYTIDEIRKINVQGTKNVLDLACKIKDSNNEIKVNHISTTYVCGKNKGVFNEDDLDLGQEFNSVYEQSKFEAEKLVGEYRKKGLRVDIFRPPFVIGEASTGKTFEFRQGIYQMLHIWDKEICDFFPLKGFAISIVFLDDLCKSIYKISSCVKDKNKTYHIFNPAPASVKTMFDIASRVLKFKKPSLVSKKEFLANNPTKIQQIILSANILIINEYIKLESKKTVKILNDLNVKLTEFNERNFLKLIEYCVSNNFLKVREESL